jgi:hypothetical protein
MILLSTSGIQRTVSDRAQQGVLHWGPASEELSIRMVAGFAEPTESKENRGCGGWIFGLGFSTAFAISKMQSFA